MDELSSRKRRICPKSTAEEDKRVGCFDGGTVLFCFGRAMLRPHPATN